MVDLDAQVYTKVFKLPHSELSPIIGDNIVGYAKFVHDLLDEFHFDPLCEFIHCNDDVCESTFDFLEWTYQIQPPKLKKAR
jgi:hypothetical protein